MEFEGVVYKILPLLRCKSGVYSIIISYLLSIIYNQ